MHAFTGMTDAIPLTPQGNFHEKPNGLLRSENEFILQNSTAPLIGNVYQIDTSFPRLPGEYARNAPDGPSVETVDTVVCRGGPDNLCGFKQCGGSDEPYV